MREHSTCKDHFISPVNFCPRVAVNLTGKCLKINLATRSITRVLGLPKNSAHGLIFGNGVTTITIALKVQTDQNFRKTTRSQNSIVKGHWDFFGQNSTNLVAIVISKFCHIWCTVQQLSSTPRIGTCVNKYYLQIRRQCLKNTDKDKCAMLRE